MKRLSVFAVIVAVFACGGCATTTTTTTPAPTSIDEERMTHEHADTLQVTLVTTSAAVAGGPLLLQMQVNNPTTTAARFCTYHTLFEGLRNNILDVKDGAGVAVDYRGIMAKRAPPRREDFITVAAGATLVSEPVDVGEAYALPAGKGTIAFSGNDISGLSASAPVTVDVATP